MTVKERYNSIISKLQAVYGQREAENITRLYLEHLGYGRWNHASSTETIENPSRVNDDVERLVAGEPLQYVTGEAHFYGLDLQVNRHTLIPRPETEELVHLIHTVGKEKAWNDVRLLDVGTGSGCIALALKQKHPGWHVTGLDVSEKALKVACSNAEKYQLDVEFVQADILKDNLVDYSQYDVMVSNPPYIPRRQEEMMDNNVLKHEPHEALFVEDTEPLVFYERMAEITAEHPQINHVFFEVSEYLGAEIVGLLNTKAPDFNVQLMDDLQTKPRIVYAERA